MDSQRRTSTHESPGVIDDPPGLGNPSALRRGWLVWRKPFSVLDSSEDRGHVARGS